MSISFVRKSPPKPSIVFDTYWKFAAERQKIFFKRLSKPQPPWTSDKIILKHKFTNAYRASDRVSQYLIKNVINKGPQEIEEIFFRIILFKTFNKIETWKLLESIEEKISYSSFSYKQYDEILSKALSHGGKIYSGAYIMPSGSKLFNATRKHQAHLQLIEMMMKENIPNKIHESKSLSSSYELLKSLPMIGSFLAYQYAIDINYSDITNFSEMDFVVPGPGALNGIKKCFIDIGDYTEADVIKYVTERQEEEFQRLNLNFRDLWGRKLQLIDCQNIFCETDKYSRVKHPEFSGKTKKTRIKQIFKSSGPIEKPFFPPKWKINDLIGKGSIKNAALF